MNAEVPPPNSGRVAVNLALIVLALALVSGWLLYFTEWFPLVGGLFTLSGVFAWLAFVSNLLTEGRAKQLQEAFDSKVLQSKRTPLLLVISLVALALMLAAGRGTLLFDGLQSAKPRTIELRTLEAGQPTVGRPHRRFTVPAGGQVKISLWTGFFSTKQVYVEAVGLPWQRVEVRWLERTQVHMPRSFEERAVVLVRPTAKDLATFARDPERFRLVVEVSGLSPLVFEPYGGEAILVGAQGGIELPEALVDSWRLEFLEAGIPTTTVQRWMQPRAAAPFTSLPAGGDISARIELTSETETSSPVHVTISPAGTASTYPLEVVVPR